MGILVKIFRVKQFKICRQLSFSSFQTFIHFFNSENNVSFNSFVLRLSVKRESV